MNASDVKGNRARCGARTQVQPECACAPIGLLRIRPQLPIISTTHAATSDARFVNSISIPIVLTPSEVVHGVILQRSSHGVSQPLSLQIIPRPPSKPFPDRFQRSSYYDAQKHSPALIRARRPYLFKNTIYGVGLSVFAFGVCTTPPQSSLELQRSRRLSWLTRCFLQFPTP